MPQREAGKRCANGSPPKPGITSAATAHASALWHASAPNKFGATRSRSPTNSRSAAKRVNMSWIGPPTISDEANSQVTATCMRDAYAGPALPQARPLAPSTNKVTIDSNQGPLLMAAATP
jgi:hypothetical protein